MISVHPAVLESMRSAAEMLMTETCTIEVQADASGDMGEPLFDQYETVATGVKCRVITIGSGLRQALSVGGREVIPEEYRIVCPHDTALDVDQRITLSDGTAWQVVSLVTDRTSEVDAQAGVVRLNG